MQNNWTAHFLKSSGNDLSSADYIFWLFLSVCMNWFIVALCWGFNWYEIVQMPISDFTDMKLFIQKFEVLLVI